MNTFAQFYKQELSAWRYRKALSRMALSHRQMALSSFRETCWEEWRESLESAISTEEPLQPVVLDSWIRTVAKLRKCDNAAAESEFLRHFRGVLDYRKSNPEYMTPLARKFHKEHKYYVA